jgi:hypothetical protein
MVPNAAYGFGKLQVAGAIYGVDLPVGPGPTLELEAPERVVAGSTFSISPRVSDPGVSISWDLDYDRIYEREAVAPDPIELTAVAPGFMRAVAEARDAQGRSVRRMARIEVVESCGARVEVDAGLGEDAASSVPDAAARPGGDVERRESCSCSAAADRSFGGWLLLGAAAILRSWRRRPHGARRRLRSPKNPKFRRRA